MVSYDMRTMRDIFYHLHLSISIIMTYHTLYDFYNDNKIRIGNFQFFYFQLRLASQLLIDALMT